MFFSFLIEPSVSNHLKIRLSPYKFICGYLGPAFLDGTGHAPQPLTLSRPCLPTSSESCLTARDTQACSPRCRVLRWKAWNLGSGRLSIWSPQSRHVSPLNPSQRELGWARAVEWALPAPVCSQKGTWVGVSHVTLLELQLLEVPVWLAASLSDFGEPTPSHGVSVSSSIKWE